MGFGGFLGWRLGEGKWIGVWFFLGMGRTSFMGKKNLYSYSQGFGWKKRNF